MSRGRDTTYQDSPFRELAVMARLDMYVAGAEMVRRAEYTFNRTERAVLEAIEEGDEERKATLGAVLDMLNGFRYCNPEEEQ